MKGSKIASMIESEMRREKFYKNKLKRRKCSIDKEKQCDKCGFFSICENREENNERNYGIKSN